MIYIEHREFLIASYITAGKSTTDDSSAPFNDCPKTRVFPSKKGRHRRHRRACKFLRRKSRRQQFWKWRFQPDVRSFIDILRARRQNNKCSGDRFLAMGLLSHAAAAIYRAARLIPKIVSSLAFTAPSPSTLFPLFSFFSHALIVTLINAGFQSSALTA